MEINSLNPVGLMLDNSMELKNTSNVPNTSVFEKILDSVSSLEQTQIGAKNEMADVLMGNSDDSHGAIIALQKAELQMSFAASVRDKVVQGTNQLFNMQI